MPSTRYNLGRRAPSDDEHVLNYPFAAATPETVERVLKLPHWHRSHIQAQTSSCVGHASVMERAIANTAQNIREQLARPWTRRYDPMSLWESAKAIDEWPDTNPGDNEGTSVRAAYDVLRTTGPRRVRTMRLSSTGIPKPVGLKEPVVADGIVANRWARTVDEIRAAIARGNAVTIGTAWYSGMSVPEKVGRDYWIARDVQRLGRMEGGHATCLYGASDRRQAFRLKNNWDAWPLVWLPYSFMDRLLREDGEAVLVTDR